MQTRLTPWKIFFAIVWLVNGLYCKVLDQVPRHRQIVGRIMGQEYERILTILIGLGEIVMAIWILNGLWHRLNVWVQILLVLTMNVIELVMVPDLLLFGRLNAVVAVAFCLLLYADEFVWHRKS